MSVVADLGHGHTIELTVWDPDLDINPQLTVYGPLLPCTAGAIVSHPLVPTDDTGHCVALGRCSGSIIFDTPVGREQFGGPYWQVISWSPLTLSPSLLCHCGDHGHITAGHWVPC